MFTMTQMRRQELETLFAATRNSTSARVSSRTTRSQRKNLRNHTTSRIKSGITSLVIDTNCFVGDLKMMKEIIQSEKWIVIVPLVGNDKERTDGLPVICY
jgi:hypothetical protein